LKYIDKTDHDFLGKVSIKVRVLIESEENLNLVRGLEKWVDLSFGPLLDDEYWKIVVNTDVMLLPYSVKEFRFRTSGVFSDAILNEIPVIATSESWVGDHVKRNEVGIVYKEGEIQDFYKAIKLLLKNYSHFKKNAEVFKTKWKEYHSISTFQTLIETNFKNNKELNEMEWASVVLQDIHKAHKSLINKSMKNRYLHNFSELELISSYRFSQRGDNQLVDVGAHEGGVTSVFTEKGWKVIAFEPEVNNRSVFLDKHADNPNITCIPKAVTDHSGDMIPFYTSDKHYGIHSIKPFHDTHSQASYEVETITLKDALNDCQIDHVSLLKVDTEGADFLALKGFDWKRFRPEMVMVEFMDDRSLKNFNYTHHDMATFMESKGYSCFVSEWSPIKGYGVKGQASEPHQWLRCVPYPLDHEPSWGNLIFVPKDDSGKFNLTLKKYLASLEKTVKTKHKKSLILKTKIFIKKTFFN
jgi:FkbM family methyltransferase